jgi:hypothetical protein
MTTTDLLTLDLFSGRIGEDFVVEEPNAPSVTLKLVEARPLRNFANAVRAPFSLIFTGPADMILPQRIYQLRNATIGTQSIFVVPIAGDAEKISYQAVFN